MTHFNVGNSFCSHKWLFSKFVLPFKNVDAVSFYILFWGDEGEEKRRVVFFNVSVQHREILSPFLSMQICRF